MANPGAFPINSASAVGQVRLFVGDTNASELVPPVDGSRSFDWFSDVALEQFLAAATGSVQRATGYAIMQLATGFAMKDGRPIKTDDLSVGASTRGNTLLGIAQAFFSEADAVDASADSSAFIIVAPAGSYSRPEATPYPLLAC